MLGQVGILHATVALWDSVVFAMCFMEKYVRNKGSALKRPFTCTLQFCSVASWPRQIPTDHKNTGFCIKGKSRKPIVATADDPSIARLCHIVCDILFSAIHQTQYLQGVLIINNLSHFSNMG